MFRFIRWLISLVVVLVILTILILWLARVSLVESILSQKLDTDVTVEAVSLGWNQVTLKNLHIENPAPSQFPTAFKARFITVVMNPLNLTKKEVHIERIKIQDPKLTVDLYNAIGTENNLKSLAQNAAPATPSKSHRTFIIDRLSISNLQIEIMRNDKTLDLPAIPYLEFQDLGRDTSSTIAQITHQLFVALWDAVLSKNPINDLYEHPKEAFHKATHSAKHQMKDGIENIKRKAEEAKEYLEHLFSK